MDEDEEKKNPIDEPEEEQNQPGDTANEYTSSMDDDEDEEGNEDEEQKNKKDKKDKDDEEDDNKDDKEHDDENTDDNNKDSEDNENDNDENTDNSNDNNENNNENSGNNDESENQKDDNQDDLDTEKDKKKDDKKDDSSDKSKNNDSSNPESPKNQNPQGNNQGGKTPNTTPQQPGGVAGAGNVAGTEGAAGAGGTAAGAGGTAATAGGTAAGAGGTAAAAGGTAAAAGGTAAAGAGAAATAATPVGWVLLIIIAIIVLIIIIVGFISFFITMPGMVVGKIRDFALGIWDGIEGYFIGAAESHVNSGDIVEMAQYLYDMGYDLEAYGFANVDSVEYEEDNKTIKDLESDCIWAYLVAENKTYLISNDNFSWKDALGEGFFSENFRENGPSGAWGSGMIHFEENFLEEISDTIGNFINPVGGWVADKVDDLISYIKVDRENNQLVMKRLNWNVGLRWPWDWARIDKTYINLEGWTGRYGKPFELLVSLHLATMAPDFVREIALNEDLDTKVNIKVKKADLEIDYFIINKGKENEEKIDVSDKSDAKDKIKELNKDGEINDDLADTLKDLLEDKTIKTYTPYIKSVTNHWFRNVYFDTNDKEKEVAEVDENGDYIYTESNGEKVLSTTTKSVNVYSIGNGDSEPFEISNTDNNFSIVGRITKGNVEQLEDAVRGPTNETTKELFNGEYYIYDGTYETAKKIQNGEVDKKPLSFTKDSLNAFSMLEQEHTLDAQLIYRDLRELLIELSYFEKEDFEENASEELKWPIPSYIPTEWPNREIEKQSTEYGTLIASKPTMDTLPEEKRTSTGFEAGSNVIAMGDATVIDFVSLDPYGEGVELKLTGDNSIKDWTLIILGIDVSDSLKINDTVKSVDTIGTTTTNDILIILRDNELSVVENVEDYLTLETSSYSSSSSSSSSLNLNITGGNAEEKIWNTFINAGYSPISTAAVMGNIYGESSFNPGVEEYSGGGGYGLCQWTGGRRTQLVNFARARGVSPASIDLQIEFLLAEITGSGADGYASYQFGGHENDKQIWLTSSNIADATTAFCAGFERPGVPRNQVRIEAAERYYDLYSK